MSESGQTLTKMDAIQYIREVQRVFQDKKDKFDEFLDVMKDYRLHRIDVKAVITKVEEILKDHEELIMGFNKFLPKGHEILLPPKDNPQMEDAINYVNKIKDRFRDKDHVYKSFLNIIASYRNGVCISELCHEVKTLFEGHPDLVRDFSIFLPYSPEE